MNVIPPVENTNNIRYADFVRVTTSVGTYRWTTAPTDITVSAVDSSPFLGVGPLVKVGDAQRDIKSTANQTTVTLIGIDIRFGGNLNKFTNITIFANSVSTPCDYGVYLRGVNPDTNAPNYHQHQYTHTHFYH